MILVLINIKTDLLMRLMHIIYPLLFVMSFYGCRVDVDKSCVSPSEATHESSDVVPPADNTIGLGKVMYTVPDTMMALDDYDVNVLVMTDTQVMYLTGKRLFVDDKIEVQLIDSSPDSVFAIKKINRDVQLIGYDGNTNWVFTVMPLKKGNGRLRTVVSTFYEDGTKQAVYTADVFIKGNNRKELKEFWKGQWKWLFTTILIPLAAYLWKTKKKQD